MESVTKIIALFRLHFEYVTEEDGVKSGHVLNNSEKSQNAKLLVEGLLKCSDQQLNQSLASSVGKNFKFCDQFFEIMENTSTCILIMMPE